MSTLTMTLFEILWSKFENADVDVVKITCYYYSI